MRVISELPLNETCFERIEPMQKWPYVWQHQSSSRLRVCSLVDNPWGREWEIKISEQKSKRDGVKKISRVDLECHEINPKWIYPKAQIAINVERGILKIDGLGYIIPGNGVTVVLFVIIQN